MSTALEQLWYDPQRVPPLHLRLAAALFRALSGLRRALYRRGILVTHTTAVPVVVVGNVTVGGAGKTPLVAALCALARERGLKPGIISRGYGGSAGRGPLRVSAADTAARVGDEPLLLARKTAAPTVVGSDRVACARLLESEVDLIISDDGLQHLRLGRALEIAVVDDARGIGNGRLLPAGPLREPAERLAAVDYVVRNGAPDGMVLEAGQLVNLREPDRRLAPGDLARDEVHAVAGIGNPHRFFAMLGTLLPTKPVEHAFSDHHAFTSADLAKWHDQCVVMTEKDAVKCAPFAGPDWWYLPVEARLAEPLEAALGERLTQLAGREKRTSSS